MLRHGGRTQQCVLMKLPLSQCSAINFVFVLFLILQGRHSLFVVFLKDLFIGYEDLEWPLNT